MFQSVAMTMSMEASSITALIVEDQHSHPVGVLHMHDILRAGVV